ncbi:hypothetical protein Pcinc_023873 [Petrolisthes cinctipes]|uniref:Uncharacterized protein n=1 Tax=Petrolisthes cinctipes TaxID=88211 RepID=A0AAE1KEG8_PETCI|nr:hypothetical protein Pcinc_023873 [Petrolisthes cinctipes]
MDSRSIASLDGVGGRESVLAACRYQGARLPLPQSVRQTVSVTSAVVGEGCVVLFSTSLANDCLSCHEVK